MLPVDPELPEWARLAAEAARESEEEPPTEEEIIESVRVMWQATWDRFYAGHCKDVDRGFCE